MPLGLLLPILAILLLAPLSATGQESLRLAMATDLQVFENTDEGLQSSEELRDALRAGALRQWQTHPGLSLEVLPQTAITSAATDAALYQGTLQLARQWNQMGVEAYRQVQSRAAVEHLERALQNFASIGHEVVAPEEIAQVLLYLSLSYLEEGTNVVRPLELLQEMIRHDPSLQIERGYYPDFIVRYYESARDTLFRELRQQGPPIEESRRIADLVDADFVFHGYAIPLEEGLELVAYLFDREADEFLPPERLRVRELTPRVIQEGFSRLASRLAVCLIEPVVEEDLSGDLMASRGTARLSVHLSLAYGSFLQLPNPIQTPFGNYGAGFGMSWSLTREFQLIAGLQVFNSLRDYDGILRDDFTTIRLVAGGQVGRRLGPFHLAMGTGMEASSFGPMRVITDPNCRPAPDLLCPGDVGTTTLSDRGLHLGIMLRPRVALLLADSLELSSSVSAGYYFSPLSDRLLNFPLISEIGIQYRF